jgi:2-polyprenyl-6-methoxyphenol hydroxylase-like FAD-dependent oxidoreductase
MDKETVLISGAGIAGPTLCYWLRAGGLKPTLIERSASLRGGGYVIDFWGLGYDIAERMGLQGDIDQAGYHMREMRIVDDQNKRVAGFGTNVFRELAGGRFVTLRRSDLSQRLFLKVAHNVETIFDEEVTGLEERENCVRVRFRRSGEREFNIVIGADGLHSNIRELVFGSQDRFEKRLGYAVAAFEVSDYGPRDDNVYVMFNEPSRMAARLSLRNDRTLFLFVFATDKDSSILTSDVWAQKAMLWERFSDMTWECPRILRELDRAQDLYFDCVSQIRMDSWSRGRTALVGDAAFCVSLMAGQGAALAMTAAYVLAGELAKADGKYTAAFANYEVLLRAFIGSKQRGAEHFASAFAPRTRVGLFLRNQVIKAFALPGLAKFAVGKDITDTLELPEYRWPKLGIEGACTA